MSEPPKPPKPLKFRIIFGGLCAFVPVKKQSYADEIMKVLLVNTLYTPPDKSPKIYEERAEPHVAMLQYNWKNFDGKTQPRENADAFFKLYEEDVTLWLQDAKGNRSPFEGRVSQVLGLVSSEKPLDTGRGLTVTAQERDLRWVPAMSEILPDVPYAAQVNPDWMAPHPTEGAVNARIDLAGGSLFAWDLAKLADEYIICRFVPPPPPPYSAVVQAVAHEVAYEVDLPHDSSVVIIGRHFVEGTERRLELQPFGGDIEIRIHNYCCGYYGEAYGNSYGRVRAPEADRDFVHFYKLCKDYEVWKKDCTTLPVPVPVTYPLRWPEPENEEEVGVEAAELALAQRGDSGGIDPLRCTMARFATHIIDPVAARAPSRQAALLDLAKPIPKALQPLTLYPGGLPDLAGRQVEDLSIPAQDQSNWCWAAVTAAIHKHRTGEEIGQCALVNHVLTDLKLLDGRNCCTDGKSKKCNRPLRTARALKVMKALLDDPEAPATFDRVMLEIPDSEKKANLIGCSLAGADGIYHAVVISGWDVWNGKPRVYIEDPWGGASRIYHHESLVNGPGVTWKRTYFTLP